MTTTDKKNKKCAVCGEVSEHLVIVSTNAFRAPDLDTRPPEMLRSTINMWIQTCPSCGYSAPDISKRIETAPKIVRSDSYQQQLDNPDFPKLANAFLCFSLIQESADDYVSAGRAAVHAAWACDDANSAAAQKCRKKAVTLLRKAGENDQHFPKQAGAEEAIISDLLRRSEQFDLALKTCDDALSKNPEKRISDILQFQKALVNKSDVAGHTIEELEEWVEGQSPKRRSSDTTGAL